MHSLARSLTISPTCLLTSAPNYSLTPLTHSSHCTPPSQVVIICIFALTNEFTRGQIGTAELQNKATRLLHSLQKISLKTIEAISHWREQLTRPFPFMFQRLNYILKILADNHVVSSSPLNQVLPMSLYDFPLCSHLPTPELFHQQLQASQGLAAYPLQVCRQTGLPPPHPTSNLLSCMLLHKG